MGGNIIMISLSSDCWLLACLIDISLSLSLSLSLSPPPSLTPLFTLSLSAPSLYVVYTLSSFDTKAKAGFAVFRIPLSLKCGTHQECSEKCYSD